MKFRHLATTTALLLAIASTTHAAEPQQLSSPNGKIKISVDFPATGPVWSISYDGKPVTEKGALAVEFDKAGAPTYTLVKADRREHRGSWKPLWGHVREIPENYNELVLQMDSQGKGPGINIEIRAYDEGVACRYVIPGQSGFEEVGITKRLTRYPFLADHPVHHHRDYSYFRDTISTMKTTEFNCVTIDLGNGLFASLADADRADSPQMNWSKPKDAGTTLTPGRWIARAKTPYATSWEAMVIGEGPEGLFKNRTLISNLNPPNAIEDSSWIKRGKAITQVYNTRIVTDELKKLLDFASANGIEYVEIDHSWNASETKWTPEEIAAFEADPGKFWADKPSWRDNISGNPMVVAKGWVPFRPKKDTMGTFVDLDIKALTAYGKSLNPPVGVTLYVRGAELKEFGGEHPVEDVFRTYAEWGIAGVKPGFVPPHSQQNERAITGMVRTAAKYKLHAVIHDAYAPSGLSRTYPNLVNIEGIAGEEAEPSIKPEMKSLHDVMIPFTRGIVGPLDYTPQFYKKSKTQAHQVSMIGVYDGRPSIRAGMRAWSPGGEGGEEFEFVKRYPDLTDEELCFTDLGKYVTIARRDGKTWYVATMGGPGALKVDRPLSFLQPGVKYRATIFKDTPGSLKATTERLEVTKDTTIPMALEPNGGHAMILEPFE